MPDARELRRMNRRLRWQRGTYSLRFLSGSTCVGRRVRRDVVIRLVQQREWRLALTVALLPTGYTLKRDDA